MVAQWSRQIWESCSIWQKFSTRRSSHQHCQIVQRHTEDMHASQAVGSGSETDTLKLHSTHLPCDFLRMHSYSRLQPLAKLLFGTVWGYFRSAFRLPVPPTLCLFPLHPTLCEASDSFSFLSSISQDVLEKREKCSTRTYPFRPRGGRWE